MANSVHGYNRKAVKENSLSSAKPAWQLPGAWRSAAGSRRDGTRQRNRQEPTNQPNQAKTKPGVAPWLGEGGPDQDFLVPASPLLRALPLSAEALGEPFPPSLRLPHLQRGGACDADLQGLCEAASRQCWWSSRNTREARRRPAVSPVAICLLPCGFLSLPL